MALAGSREVHGFNGLINGALTEREGENLKKNKDIKKGKKKK